jgi:hypothetical protein
MLDFYHSCYKRLPFNRDFSEGREIIQPVDKQQLPTTICSLSNFVVFQHLRTAQVFKGQQAALKVGPPDAR